MTNEHVMLSHGSGTGLSELLNKIVLPALQPVLRPGPLEDAAVVDLPQGRPVFTTDAFVVSPRRFAGGDIGKLAACGTINDLAMMGAVPHALSVSLIAEEGLALRDLQDHCTSLAAVCRACEVAVVCGDTKVVERGKGDDLFIVTSGIGTMPSSRTLSVAGAGAGDTVIVSGPVGRHGIAILAGRGELNFASSIESDCAPLAEPVRLLLDAVPGVRTLRDATRGGVAAVLNEIADAAGVTLCVDEEDIPVDAPVRAACDFLGIDPLEVANEGTFVAVVPAGDTEKALATLAGHPHTGGARVIGRVKARERFGVLLRTSIGGMRPVEVPHGRLLPRIC